ncbi:MAG: hypothetical protein U5L96_21705 [Owenweeksia sp.]|nr:hypothetical protein [Owenweeksia sp.]
MIQGEGTPATSLAEFTPVQVGSKGFEEITVSYAGNFDLFKVTDQEREYLNDLPPLWSPFGRPQLSAQSYTLLHKKVGSVQTTDPIWFFVTASANDDQRQAYTLGTGLWRWRLHDYRQNRSHEHFNGLIQKTVQYLTTRAQNDRFRVDMATRFGRGEPIVAEARLYNPSLELTNDPEANLQFTGPEGDTYDFSFTRTHNTYRLNAGKLPPGVYTWQANTELSGEKFTDRGSIAIEESNLRTN